MSPENIFEAAAAGDIDYLEHHVAKHNEQNERGWTALHFAARFGQLAAAQFLKDKGADLTIVNADGKTAGQVASLWGNDQVAQLLTVAEKGETSEGVLGSPFPDNYTAVFAGNPLNRFGWKRADPQFLSKLARSPSTKYLVLNKLQALYNDEGDLQYVNYNQVSSIVDRVYTEKGVNEKNSDIILVFLGIDERPAPATDGVAHFALDLTPKGNNEAEYTKLIEEFKANSWEFAPTLPRGFVMDKSVSSILAQAAAMVDWNARNAFCAGCGKRTVSDEAGHKRSCLDDDPVTKCISHMGGVQNFTYPRTDAVVIVCIVHPDGEKILLGRSKRFPKKMYSCLAGFVEAAETLEEAVRREAFEEAGVFVDRVAYHNSQPWPFPNSLMLGFIAEAASTEINISFDKELEDAQWFTRSEVIAALSGEPGTLFSMAPKGALAHTLVSAWVNDKKWQTAKM